MTTSPKRAALYARISETVAHRDKVADQLAASRRLAERRGWIVVAAFEDDGISALGGKERPGFVALLDAAMQGDFDVIVATEEERLARNVAEKAELEETCREAGVVWETERDGFVDPATEAGEFFSTMRAAMGRMESRRKASRQRAANADRASRGEPNPGRRRFGYEIDGRTLRPAEAAVVARIFEHVASGGSIRSIAQALTAEGVDPGTARTWRTGRIREIASNPHYGGAMRHRGQVIPSEVITPAVDPELAAEVRAILADEARRTTPGPTPRHLGSGSSCGVCGGAMRSLAGTYRCPDAQHPCIKMSILDERIRTEVARAFLHAHDAILYGSEAASIAPLVDKLTRNDEAAAATAADRDEGLLSPASARARLVELRAERVEIEQRIDAARVRGSETLALGDVARELIGAAPSSFSRDEYDGMVAAIAERFAALDIDRQRAAVRALLHVSVYPGRGPGRVSIEHAVATWLNPHEDAVSAHALGIQDEFDDAA
ncbi:recombinase family protein [Agromyces sp. M3QZ16-3]|uniref:recombinase family protein n=1 Tax=Agromyces sp. M3QZ16-3 TaxID=3447585 RepID=UPI003F691A55